MDTDRNAELAKWIDKPWAWKRCMYTRRSRAGCCDSFGLAKNCPLCHGTGRVAAELHEPDYIWRLIGWCGSLRSRQTTEPLDKISFLLSDLWEGIKTVKQTSLEIRDLIYEAEKQWREGR